jgi:hypothetical protein
MHCVFTGSADDSRDAPSRLLSAFIGENQRPNLGCGRIARYFNCRF